MSTIRGVKDRRFKFVQLLNSMFEDQSLSLKAKGFIGYCLTKPSDWKFHVSHLCTALKEGERAIYSTLEECERLGYAIRYQTRKDNGDFGEWETLISDSKEEIAALKEDLKKDPGFQKMFTLRRFADARVADAQNAPPSNTDDIKILEEQQQQAAPPIAAVDKPIVSESIEYTTPSGLSKKISESEIYAHFVRKKFNTETIQKAIQKVKNKFEPIGNILKLLEIICEAIEREPRGKSLNEKYIPSHNVPLCTAKGVSGSLYTW